jgi:hypothetical protein
MVRSCGQRSDAEAPARGAYENSANVHPKPARHRYPDQDHYAETDRSPDLPSIAQTKILYPSSCSNNPPEAGARRGDDSFLHSGRERRGSRDGSTLDQSANDAANVTSQRPAHKRSRTKQGTKNSPHRPSLRLREDRQRRGLQYGHERCIANLFDFRLL